MHTLVPSVFALVYIGLFFGGWPGLKLDRTGIALLGAIVLIATGAVPEAELWQAVHAPTLGLLFAFMVISAQLRLGGFYTWVVLRLGRARLTPAGLLAAFIAAVAALSAVFSNDIICLAMAPVLIGLSRARRLDPLPFLLALACAANIGSAATLIGNPQNILIGETLGLAFADYSWRAMPTVLFSLIATWAILAWFYRGRWHAASEAPPALTGDWPDFDPWQTGKGLLVAALLLVAFAVAPWPRDLLALGGAAVLLTSRRLHSRRVLDLIDWHLLVLFIGLFILNHALQQTGLLARGIAALAAAGIDPGAPLTLLLASVGLSNLVSNVPAVMLLLPSATEPGAGPLLALSSTLAGNLLIVGSIANLIVAQEAARHGILIDWWRHARVGVPVSLVSLGAMLVLL